VPPRIEVSSEEQLIVEATRTETDAVASVASERLMEFLCGRPSE